MTKKKSNSSEGIDIGEALDAPIRFKRDGKVKSMSAYEALLRQHLKKALSSLSVPSMKFILGEAEKHRVLKKEEPQQTSGVFVVPKYLPDELQDEIFSYRPEEGEREPMSRTWNIIRRFIEKCKSQAKEKSCASAKTKGNPKDE